MNEMREGKKEQEDLLVLLADQDTKLKTYRRRLKELGEKVMHVHWTSAVSVWLLLWLLWLLHFPLLVCTVSCRHCRTPFYSHSHVILLVGGWHRTTEETFVFLGGGTYFYGLDAFCNAQPLVSNQLIIRLQRILPPKIQFLEEKTDFVNVKNPGFCHFFAIGIWL